MWAMHIAPKPPGTSGFIGSIKLGLTSYSSPTLANNTLYLGVDTRLVALDARNYSTLWSFPTGGYIESSPAVSGNTVYIGSDDGKIYALDATSGQEIWDITTGDKVTSSPTVANGILYVGSHDGKLYAIK
jgi:outer membrane protein assembly factor BamB